MAGQRSSKIGPNAWFQPLGFGPNPPWRLHYALVRGVVSVTEYHLLAIVQALSKYDKVKKQYTGCFASKESLAKEVGVTKRWVQQAISKLIKIGLLEADVRGNRRYLSVVWIEELTDAQLSKYSRK